MGGHEGQGSSGNGSHARRLRSSHGTAAVAVIDALLCQAGAGSDESQVQADDANPEA